MWLIGVGLVLAIVVAVLIGIRIWFDRMQDVRTPRDAEAEERNRAVIASTIFINGNLRI